MPKAVVENLKSFFSTVADSILKEWKYEGDKSYQDFLQNPFEELFAFDPADEAEVSALISKLNKGKTNRPYSIHAETLHNIKDEISKSLTKLINASFTTGVHPANVKISKTIPIFKPRITVSNYRPISLLGRNIAE